MTAMNAANENQQKPVDENVKKLAAEVARYRRKVAGDLASAQRYSRATLGARVLMSYLAWASDHRTEDDSEAGRAYRALLFAWVSLREFAFVLQAESDVKNVAILKDGILTALERETSPERIERKPKAKGDEFRLLLALPETAVQARNPADCFASGMEQGGLRFRCRVLTCDTLPMWPFNPDHSAHSAWEKVNPDRIVW